MIRVPQLWRDDGAAWLGLAFSQMPLELQIHMLDMLDRGQRIAREAGQDDLIHMLAGALAHAGRAPTLAAWAVAMLQQKTPN